MTAPLAAGTGSSVVVERCQVCSEPDLQPVLFLGYLPPVNLMPTIGDLPREQPSYPALLLRCPRCELVQLGLVVDPRILFPPSYPYTSGTTRILRENFAELYRECRDVVELTPDDLVIDIGSNDGTLLSNFVAHRVLGVEPSDVGYSAIERGIPTEIEFFTRALAERIAALHGRAKVVTATNVFAHIEDVHSVLDGVMSLLSDDGVFVSESHYLIGLLETVQYDTIYHEHLRYYSLTSLAYLLREHGLRIIHAKRIPTHGGSIRVYATQSDSYHARDTVQEILAAEREQGLNPERLGEFKAQAVLSKLQLHALLVDLKQRGARIHGIGAPSRASTLINYVGLDDGILDCVLEVKDSHKVGKYIPGTLIPVFDEQRLFDEQPEYAMLLSWHIADELIPKLIEKGYRGDFIVPLPTPSIVRSSDIAV
jgi:hypothetical protein